MKNTQENTPQHHIFTRQIILFLMICFGFSWAVAALIWQAGGLQSPLAGLLMVIYMFGPAYFTGLSMHWLG